MAKMIKLWEEEDEGKEDEDDEEDLADKQELMKGYNVLDTFLDQAKGAAHQIKGTALVEGKKALATALNVHEMDAETQKYALIHQRVVDDLDEARKMEEELKFGLKKRNKRHAPLLQRYQEAKVEADRVQQAQLVDEIERRRREQTEKAMQEKQRQLEEKTLNAERQLVQRRQMNLKFWQKQLVEAREFAEQQMLDKRREEEFQKKVEDMKREIQIVEEEEKVDANRALIQENGTRRQMAAIEQVSVSRCGYVYLYLFSAQMILLLS
ncbi:hypothetical protein BBJ29_003770 [Phytophthora kernoviae]|uniref:Uncharacterized protein n=1 Tax=Phytophthora kernoviae TaxID=325452 RepID=A0A3F2RXS0_9STRA|nr:hypothetical protein BBJ29_003770 [Phytophthora kernoviae]RLN66307.1 hypothetical protein BBP00_00002309 [Phytophthora kernoviae]